MCSAGGITSASPEITTLPFWFVHTHSSVAHFFSASSDLTVSFTVRVSPTRTGAEKRSVWLR